MHDPIHAHQWDVRAAYRKGWEERMACYDGLLRGVLELIEGAVRLMTVDGLSEAIEELRQASLAIENVTVSLEWTSALAARENQMEREGNTG
jgi:aspartyl/asparaginyl-tRNA synthetase